MSFAFAPLPSRRWFLPWLSLLLLGLLLSPASQAAKKPDLARLYASAAQNPNQPPVILIHGLMGSTLVDRHTGKEYWPGSIGALAFSNYRDLAQLSPEDREGEGLVPGDLFFGIGGVDFYSALSATLEKVGRFQRGTPGVPVHGPEDRRRYYVLLYDWRKDNTETVKKLHALIDQIRVDYGDPNLRVDIVAHSNGGLIANYYLRYGPRDVLEDGDFVPWSEGPKRIRRLVMLGTPTLGSVKSVERLAYGMRIALRVIPVEVLATIVTPFEALPHPWLKSIVDRQGKPLDMDIYDPELWRSRQWSVFSPEVVARVRSEAGSAEAGDRAVAELQADFLHNLHRAKRFQLALSAPFDAAGVDTAVFGGDCDMTSARGMLVEDDKGSHLLFRPAETAPTRILEPRSNRPVKLDYEGLLAAPGDGLVTRASQVGRGNGEVDEPRHDFHFFPHAQTFFLCEEHSRLTSNRYFQNNLLYFLLSR